MPYIALYRKYRSQTFEDVLGQEHVTRTIQNAIAAGRMGHAYLFCGSRGTGKTTVARIIAKAVNCETDRTGHPCNACAACTAISEGSAVDVVELDAASHRGVGDVADIRESVKYQPMHLRYKVYIIDEVHQLSRDGKDAFLKTLEEPPDHAIFILATTEAHAIPPTIRSRCQQFDFRRGTLESISERLRYVAKNEGIELQDEAVRLLAEAAAGSWRDALSLLEQVIAYSGEMVTGEDVINVLGTVGSEILREATEVIASRDAAFAFGVADRLVAEGKDIGQLLKSLSAHFRDLLFTASGAVEAASGRFNSAELKELASKFTRSELLRVITVFSEAERELRWNDQQRLVLEMALFKAIEEPVRPVVAQREIPAQPVSPPVPKPPPPKMEAPVQPEEPPLIETFPDEVRKTPVGANDLTIHDIRKVWDQVLSALRGGKSSASVYAIIRDAKPLQLEGDVLTLAYGPRYKWHRDRLQQQDASTAVEAALAKVVGTPLRIKVVVQEVELQKPLMANEQSAETSDIDDPESVPAKGGSDTSGDDLLKDVLEVFEGAVVEDKDDEEDKNPWEEK